MTGKPIIFSAPMVQALLAGRKTQTRRIGKVRKGVTVADLKWDGPVGTIRTGRVARDHIAVPYAPGDRLYVKHAADCFPVYFKPIPFGAGKYAVGTDGHVYARSEAGWEKRAVRLSHNGYEEINLRYNGEQRPFRVNRLVAEAFYGPAPEGYVCRHMDGSRRNNQPGNLDWGTPEQNSADASAAGSFSGEQASKARLSARDVEEIRASVEPQAVLAERFGITQPTVSKIKSGKRWAEPGDAPPWNLPAFQLWRSPIFCPRWASRLTLTVTEVRVQRLQEISEDDAVAEGVERLNGTGPNRFSVWLGDGWFNDPSAQECFARLWRDIHGPDAWEANPWVVAISFTVQHGNIDAVANDA
jgi:hypothetical protein